MQEEKGRSSRRNGFVDGSGEATADGKLAGPPGTSSHRRSFRNTSHINSDPGDVRCLRADGSVST